MSSISRPGLVFSAQASLQQISEPAICLAKKPAWFHYILTLIHIERRTQHPHSTFSSYILSFLIQTRQLDVSHSSATLSTILRKKWDHRSKVTRLQESIFKFTNRTVRETLKAPFPSLYKVPSDTTAGRQQISSRHPEKKSSDCSYQSEHADIFMWLTNFSLWLP